MFIKQRTPLVTNYSTGFNDLTKPKTNESTKINIYLIQSKKILYFDK